MISLRLIFYHLYSFSILSNIIFNYQTVLADGCQHIYQPLPYNFPKDFGSQGTSYALDNIWIVGHLKDSENYKYGFHVGFFCKSSSCKEEDLLCSYNIGLSDQRRNRYVSDLYRNYSFSEISFTDSLVKMEGLTIKRTNETFLLSIKVKDYSFSVITKIITKNLTIPLANNGFYQPNPDSNNKEGSLFFSHVTQGMGEVSFDIENPKPVFSEVLYNRYVTSNTQWFGNPGWIDRWTLVYLSNGALLHLYVPYYANYTRSTYIAAGSYYFDGESTYLTYDDFTYEESHLWISSMGNAYNIYHEYTIPKLGLTLAAKPLIDDNETFYQGVSFEYYEAISNFHGYLNNKKITGVGITEVTRVI